MNNKLTITEGKTKLGGVKNYPTTLRPPEPKGQGGRECFECEDWKDLYGAKYCGACGKRILPQ